jgi:6-phosphogluconolactonase
MRKISGFRHKWLDDFVIAGRAVIPNSGKDPMKIEVFEDVDSVARAGAAMIAEHCRAIVASRGRFVIALSGGHTPWVMFRLLAKESIPWQSVHVFQVDERVAPAGDPDRNLTGLHESLLEHTSLRKEQIHTMPVESADLKLAAEQYSATLRNIAGSPPVLDLAHLGLGPDGHTASLVPGDSDLDAHDTDVAVSGVYQGRRRLTLTYPVLNRARKVLWIVTGSEKAAMLRRLTEGDVSIPAGRVRPENAIVLADREAATRLPLRSQSAGGE